jgi:hypothetical protein
VAKLNNVEGSAHVKVNDDNTHWHGYILVPRTPRNLLGFDAITWSMTEVSYVGPVLFEGKYYFGRGTARIQMVKDIEDELRVDFSSHAEFSLSTVLEEQPADFIVD